MIENTPEPERQRGKSRIRSRKAQFGDSGFPKIVVAASGPSIIGDYQAHQYTAVVLDEWTVSQGTQSRVAQRKTAC